MTLAKFGAPSGLRPSPWHGFLRVALMVCCLVLCAVAWPQGARAQAQTHEHATEAEAAQPGAAAEATQQGATPVAAAGGISYHAPLVFTLRTGIAGGRMVYIGVGGTIDGQTNPDAHRL